MDWIGMTLRNDNAGSAAMADAPVFSIVDAANAARPVADEEPRPLIVDPGEPTPYPVDALCALAKSARAIQAHTQAPVAIAGQSVLCACALVAQAHADVVLPTTNRAAPLSLFAATIALSGERKTAVDSLALQPVRDKEDALADQHRQDIQKHRDEKAIYDAAHETAMKDLKRSKTKFEGEADLRALGEPPEPPLTPMLTCPEPTFEGYVKLTAEGSPALGIFSDEGGAFIGGHGLKKDDRLKTAAALCDLWGGRPIKRVRAGEGAFMLRGRRLSMHLLAQPTVAWRLLSDEELADQGLLSRLLTTYPASTMGTRLYRPPDDAAKADLRAYHRRLSVLLDASQPLREGSRNELAPRALPLSMAAANMAIAFADHVEHELREDGDYRPISGFANKAVEHACRIAAVLALYDKLDAPVLSAEMMEGGIELTKHFLAEMSRLREATSAPQDLLQAQKLLDWLQSKWREPAIYPTPIYQKGPDRSMRSKKAAVAALETLEDHGWIWRIPGGAEIEGAHRHDAWAIYGRRPAS